MSENEYILSVFDKSVEIGQGWEMDGTRASGYRQSYVAIKNGAKIKVHFNGCAISLLRGSVWQALPIQDGIDYDLPNSPNPLRPVGSIETEKYVISINGGVPCEIDLATAHLEIPLAENLSLGDHVLEIEATGPGQTSILGFRVMKISFGSIIGIVNGECANYLNDVNVTIMKDGSFYDKRLSRNPFTCELLLWGLAPGNYDIEIEALGWKKTQVNNLKVKIGSKVSFGEVHLLAEKMKRLPMPIKIKRSDCFRIVKVGHLDTWTQRNAEYLAKIVELTNLYDPDLFLISNEANWQYVSGALNNLRVPYMITSGNHGLPGFDLYYGNKLKKVDIGPVSVVVYNAPWKGITPEIESAFQSSPNAKIRVLQGVESDIDQDWAKCLNLNLYLCAHDFKKEHADSAPWLHLGKEFQVVDINLTNKEIEVIKSPNLGGFSREKYPISRENSLASIVYTAHKNGKQDCVKATIKNPMQNSVKDCSVQFHLPIGEYISSVGKLKVIEMNQNNNTQLVEVRIDLPEKETIEIVVMRM
jgi:hypothetical protein